MTPAAVPPVTAPLDVSSPEARRRLRDALGHFATGVTIVTATGGDGPPQDVGLTVNSFTSVSLDPPLVLWCLGRNSTAVSAFAGASHFAVNVLGADQQDLALRFADPVADKFRDLAVERGAGNVPLLPGCIARLQCRQREVLEGGDHLILIGEILAMEQHTGHALLFYRGRFSTTVRRSEDGPAEG